MKRGMQQPGISGEAIVIPLDAPKDGEPSEIGYYQRRTGLPWLVEDLANDMRGAQALIATMHLAAMTGLDALRDGQLERALDSIECQLHRCAAMADRVVSMILAEGRASHGGRATP